MNWQDLIITIGNLVFSISLIPQIYHGFKEKTGPIKYQTSVPTVIFLYAFIFAFYSLHLYFSAIVSALTGTMWLLLFIQRLQYKK